MAYSSKFKEPGLWFPVLDYLIERVPGFMETLSSATLDYLQTSSLNTESIQEQNAENKIAILGLVKHIVKPFLNTSVYEVRIWDSDDFIQRCLLEPNEWSEEFYPAHLQHTDFAQIQDY